MTMDRIIVAESDLEYLENWRDNHKDLVRLMPMPIKAIKIICKEKKLSVKIIREGDKVTMYPFYQGESLGRIQYMILNKGYSITKLELLTSKDGKKADAESLMTIYATIMAFMVYGKETETEAKVVAYSPAVEELGVKLPNSVGKPKCKRGNKVTYILTKNISDIAHVYGRKRRSPVGEFNVRGHYRTYPSGKRVWIPEYTKGKGKFKKKTYKI